MTAKNLVTIETVIEALGGSHEVAALTGRNAKAVSMWKTLDRFPANTFLIMTKALEQRGCHAPTTLWRMPAAIEQELTQ